MMGTVFFISQNDAVYFSAVSNNLYAIYKTKSTKNSLSKITPDYSYIQSFSVTNNGLVFYVVYNYNTSFYELWRTDGTASGTALLSPTVYYANYLNVIGNTALFVAGDDEHGYELWKSDGTKGGTKMVKDINPGVDGSYPGGLFLYNNEVYFGAYDGVNHAFWKSDGTKAGTAMVKNIDPWWGNNLALTEPYFCISNNILYFSALDYASGKGTELWKTDGTRVGTKVIKDINPSDSSVSRGPYYLTDVNGTVFFTANDGEHGTELWKTDGTASGTQLVKDINPGSSGSIMGGLTSFEGKLYFQNVSFTDFRNYLWSSDGTAEGTNAVEDPGIVNVGVGDLLTVGNKLFLYGYSLEYGGELYAGKPEGESARFIANKSATSTILENTFNVLLSPNPAVANATLQLTGNTNNVSVSVTDINGKTLWQSSINNSKFVRLPTEKYSPGIYFVTVTNGKESKTLKLVKQ